MFITYHFITIFKSEGKHILPSKSATNYLDTGRQMDITKSQWSHLYLLFQKQMEKSVNRHFVVPTCHGPIGLKASCEYRLE